MSDNKDSVSAGRLKIFLSEKGVLMVGKFPEEPFWDLIPNNPSGDSIVDNYNAAVEAAKASAVEVVESGNLLLSNGPLYLPSGEKLNKGQLYDFPPGWTVEYEDNTAKLIRNTLV